MQQRVNLVRTGIEAKKWRVEGGCEHLSGDAELFIKGELSNIDWRDQGGGTGVGSWRERWQIPWECLNPLFLQSWSEGTLAHKAGCDKYRFCTGLQLGFGADWTNHVPVLSVNSPWAIAADDSELNISPAEAECVVFHQLSPPAPNGWVTLHINVRHPTWLLLCLCSAATKCHLSDNLMGVGFTILWSFKESLKAYLQSKPQSNHSFLQWYRR